MTNKHEKQNYIQILLQWMAIGVHGLVMAHVVGHAEEVSSNGKENVTILRQNTEELNVLEIKSRQLPVKPATAHVILEYYLDKSSLY